ncbi:MAG: hypothetical protein AB7G93_01620 [Bdellovibrionales bacterium]
MTEMMKLKMMKLKAIGLLAVFGFTCLASASEVKIYHCYSYGIRSAFDLHVDDSKREVKTVAPGLPGESGYQFGRSYEEMSLVPLDIPYFRLVTPQDPDVICKLLGIR